MHIVTVDVMSANGKVTKGNGDAHSWTSAADWKHFSTLWAEHNVLVMDDITYEKVQPMPDVDHLRMVVTKHPKTYAKRAVKGQLEFVNETPAAIVKRLEKQQFTAMLLVGKEVNAQFLQAGLVDEMYITVEPVLFGNGTQLLDYQNIESTLRLVSVKQLNERGTLVVHYQVDR